MYKQIDSNRNKTVLLIFFFFAFIVALGYVFGMAYDSYYGSSDGILLIMPIAMLFAIFSSIFSYYFSEKIAIFMSGAHFVTREEEKELYQLVENLCISIGLPQPKIHVIETDAMNAFATGRNPAHSSIAVTRGLLNTLNKNEIQGVLSHEMSHIKNYDILIATIVVVMVGVVQISSDLFLRSGNLFGGKKRDSNGGGANPIFLIIGLVLAILSPLIALVIQMAISRKREYLADADGALMTRYPEGLASALEKISANPYVKKSSSATAHMYIASPLRGSFAGLFSTHPPMEKRIAALRAMIAVGK